MPYLEDYTKAIMQVRLGSFILHLLVLNVFYM